MMIRPKRFNLYFACALVLALAGGCANEESKRKHVLTTLDIHLEVPNDSSKLNEAVPIFREKPVMVNVLKEPILTEAHVKDAKVVEMPGGFAIQIEFNRQGTWLLEQVTDENHGKRLAVHCDFGPKLKESRWLAAPRIVTGITDGTFTFTPDATREESDQIVLGLHDIGQELQKHIQ
jgi:preprotein translocase subunit SecD